MDISSTQKTILPKNYSRSTKQALRTKIKQNSKEREGGGKRKREGDTNKSNNDRKGLKEQERNRVLEKCK